MFRWCRLFMIFISSFFQKKILLSDISTLSFRVWPQEADKKYMNNASFWTITEMGQMEFLFRTGLYKFCRRYHWSPLVGSQKMVYRKPLKRFERYQLKSKIIFYDDKWLYFEQTFQKNNQMIANSLIKVLFRSKDGNIPVQKILSVLGQKLDLTRKPLIDHSEFIDDTLIELDDV
jgi:acyl-CoA thioesterase FadM